MKEIPILFNGAMVRAILAGKKTQTRRPFKIQPPEGWCPNKQMVEIHGMTDGELDPDKVLGMGFTDDDGEYGYVSPFGIPGYRLWVRENFCSIGWGHEFGCEMHYQADGHDPENDWTARSRYARIFCDVPDHDDKWRLMSLGKWRPSIHMPRWASRITLEVESVWVERVKDITEDGAQAEGVDPIEPPAVADSLMKAMGYGKCLTHVSAFATLWESIYGAKGLGWDANPWVWCCAFKRV